jgi:hypothetical protein
MSLTNDRIEVELTGHVVVVGVGQRAVVLIDATVRAAEGFGDFHAISVPNPENSVRAGREEHPGVQRVPRHAVNGNVLTSYLLGKTFARVWVGQIRPHVVDEERPVRTAREQTGSKKLRMISDIYRLGTKRRSISFRKK